MTPKYAHSAMLLQLQVNTLIYRYTMFTHCVFHRSQLAVQIVYEDAKLKRTWKDALAWLNGELEKVSFSVKQLDRLVLLFP